MNNGIAFSDGITFKTVINKISLVNIKSTSLSGEDIIVRVICPKLLKHPKKKPELDVLKFIGWAEDGLIKKTVFERTKNLFKEQKLKFECVKDNGYYERWVSFFMR